MKTLLHVGTGKQGEPQHLPQQAEGEQRIAFLSRRSRGRRPSAARSEGASDTHRLPAEARHAYALPLPVVSQALTDPAHFRRAGISKETPDCPDQLGGYGSRGRIRRPRPVCSCRQSHGLVGAVVDPDLLVLDNRVAIQRHQVFFSSEKIDCVQGLGNRPCLDGAIAEFC